MMRILNTLPVRAKVLEHKTFALTGRSAINTNTQGDALGYGETLGLQPALLVTICNFSQSTFYF